MIGMIYARMDIGGYITVVPTLKLFGAYHFNCIYGSVVFSFRGFVIFFLSYPRDAAPKLVFTTTETPNSRLRPILARTSDRS